MSYATEGYVIRGGLPLELLEGVRTVLADALRRIGDEPVSGDLNALIAQREAQDHDLVYQASNFVGSSLAAYRLVEAVSEVVERETGCSNLHIMPTTVAIQQPDDGRFDYKWHQETSFYPWTDNVINVWIPLQPTRVGNGTMFVLPGSQQGGRRDAEQYFSYGQFRQIECEADDGELATEVPMELALGEYVIFDGNLVHRSDGNHGEHPRLVAIMRFLPADDLKKLRPLYKALSYED